MRGPAGAEAHPPDPGNRWPEREGDLGARARGGGPLVPVGGRLCLEPIWRDQMQDPGRGKAPWRGSLVFPLAVGLETPWVRLGPGQRQAAVRLPDTERSDPPPDWRADREAAEWKASPAPQGASWVGGRAPASPNHPRRPARAAAKPWRWVRRAGERSRDAPRAGWEPAETPREVPGGRCWRGPCARRRGAL